MFYIRRLELVRWDYWQRFEISLDAQIVTVVGPNGSGKTTLLDSLRTLLGLECSGRRSYKTYVRHASAEVSWLRALVDNHRVSQGQRHPFWPLIEEHVTLFCRIQRHGGEWSRQYLIVSGNSSIEEVLNRKDWLGVQEYRRRLASAGLTPAISQVLSLEQGDTDRLCEYAPRALLDLVFQVFGDQQVLDKYRNARYHQDEAVKELRDFEVEIDRLDASRMLVESRLNNYMEWQALKTRRTYLEAEVLPVFAWIEQRVALRKQQNDVRGIKLSLSQTRALVSSLQAEFLLMEEALGQARASEQVFREARESAQQIWSDTKLHLERTQALLRERDRLQILSEQQSQIDQEATLIELNALQNEYHLLSEKIRIAQQELSGYRQQVQTLQQGGRVAVPSFVMAMRQRLDEKRIPHQLLSDIVEILDAHWQGAAEALLAPYRYVILVERSGDLMHAMQIGESIRYRHFVTADKDHLPATKSGTMLEVVQFSIEVPSWIAEPLNRFKRVQDVEAGKRLSSDMEWITRDGYVRERRGGRSRYVDPCDWQLGEAARRSRLVDYQHRIEALQAEVAKGVARRDHISSELSRLKSLFSGTDAAKLLRDRSHEFVLAEEKKNELQSELSSLGPSLEKAINEQDEANRLFQQAQLDFQSISNELNRATLERQRAEGIVQSTRHRLAKEISEWRLQRRKISPKWWSQTAQRSLLEQYESIQAVRRELMRVCEHLQSDRWETDETLIPRRDKLVNDLNAQRAEALRRAQDNQQARQHTEDARSAYIEVLKTTVRRYAANLKAVSELAGVRIEVDMPHLENDDDILVQAGLTLRFNFDNKGMIGLNDGEASGGQQVMKSLILLVALLSDDAQPGGFVFIDEPFAHLDVRNIQRVGAFLRATRAQYIITTPVTHHVEVYDPTDLTLIARKKAGGATWAEPIAMLQRKLEVA